jgi:hypothetical protein
MNPYALAARERSRGRLAFLALVALAQRLLL